MEPTRPAIRIRNARADDAPGLAPLLAELGFPSTVEQVTIRLGTMLAAGEVVLVAVGPEDGKLLGMTTVHVTPVLHRPTSVGRLTALVVKENARGRGIGRALVLAGEALLADRGCALVEITSNRRLTDAHSFYEHLGYERTSHRFKKSLVE